MFNPKLLIAPLAAFLIGMCALRIIRRIALAVGFVDSPDRRRKLQKAPIPLGGGLAVWLAAWTGWGISVLGGLPDTGGVGDARWFYLALAVATSALMAVGVVDDRSGLRGRHKLAGQLVAAVILVGSGLRIDALSCFSVEVELGIFAYPVTVFWILLVVNAFNLIDGMDGFCGSVGLVASLAISVLACWSGHARDAILGLALVGGLAAFLRYNLPPARIYLGDAGSMTLGMMISALSVRACSVGPNSATSFPLLVALLTLPLLDVVTAIGRRWLTGRSLFAPDRGHIHHRLRTRLGSTVATLRAAVGLAVFGAAGATLAKVYGVGDGAASLVVVVSVGLLVCTNTFGKSEILLLLFRIQTALTSLLAGGTDRRGAIRQECRLHGVRDWAKVWGALIRRAEAGGVWRIELAIDMTAAGEVYHGLWSLPSSSEDVPSWSVVHTLHAGGAPAGILRVAGSVDACQSRYLHQVEELVRMLEGLLESDDLPRACPSPLSPLCENLPFSAPLTSV